MGAVVVLLALPLFEFVAHTSGNPIVFHKYSIAYSLFLLLYLGILLGALVGAAFLFKSDRRETLLQSLFQASSAVVNRPAIYLATVSLSVLLSAAALLFIVFMAPTWSWVVRLSIASLAALPNLVVLRIVGIRTFLATILKLMLANVAGICLAVLLLEIVLRKTTRQWGYFVPSSDLGWTFQADLDVGAATLGPSKVRLRTNSLGFREAPEPGEIPPDAIVIAIQGDSIVAGYGLQPWETLPDQLQQYLKAHVCGERPCVVLNLGANGWDPNQYLTQAEDLPGYNYDIDVLVMVFNLGNDFASSAMAHTYLLPRPYYNLTPDGLELVHPAIPVHVQSYGYEFIPAYAEYNYLLQPLNADRYIIDPESLLSSSRVYVEVATRLHRLGAPNGPGYSEAERELALVYTPYYGTWNYVVPTPEPYRTHESTMAALLQRWAETPFDHLMVLFPDKAQVCAEMQETQSLRATDLQLGALDSDMPTRRMVRLAESAGIRVIDPLPLFRQTADGCSTLFLPGGAHPSAHGNQLLAQMIGEALPAE